MLLNLNVFVYFGLLQALSHVVIHFNSASTGSATNFANSTDPTDFTNSNTATAASITAFKLVPNLVDDLLSPALLTSAVLYSLNLGSFAYLLLTYLFYFSSPFFFKTILVFLISCFYLCLAILQILYRPVEKLKKL